MTSNAKKIPKKHGNLQKGTEAHTTSMHAFNLSAPGFASDAKGYMCYLCQVGSNSNCVRLPWLFSKASSDVQRRCHDASHGLRHPCCVTPKPHTLGHVESSRVDPAPPAHSHGTSTAFALSLPNDDRSPKGCVQGTRYFASTWERPRVTPRSSGTRPEGNDSSCQGLRSPPQPTCPRVSAMCIFPAAKATGFL